MQLRFISVWWLATFVLFLFDLFGVYENAPNIGLLSAYMSSMILMVFLLSFASVPVFHPFLTTEQAVRSFFRISLIVSLILLPINIKVYTGASLGQFVEMALNPAEAYFNMHFQIAADRTDRLGFLLAKLLVSWLTIALAPLAILLYMNKVIRLPKLLVAVSISLVLSVFRGTDKELADLFIYILAAVLAGKTFENDPSRRTMFSIALRPRNLLLLLPVVLVLGIAFGFRKSERLGDLYLHCFQNTNVCYEYTNSGGTDPVFIATLLYRYLTHGYYGLASSFDAVWNICPIAGHSRTLAYFAEKIGYTCTAPLMAALDDVGWTSVGAWSTGFTQLASDFGYLFTFVQVAIFAILMKVFYNTYKFGNCYISGILYILNFYILFYMVANLQIQQSGESYFGYIFLTLFVFVRQLFRRRRSQYA